MALESLNFGRFIFIVTSAPAAIFARRGQPRRVMGAIAFNIDELCHCCQQHHALGIQFLSPVNALKKIKSVSTAVKYAILKSSKIAPHASRKANFAIYGSLN